MENIIHYKSNVTFNPAITHRPKGRMCFECRFAKEFAHCDDLSFTKMKPIGKDKDGVIIVKFDSYEKAKTTAS